MQLTEAGPFRCYSNELPHWRLGEATYFVTWRLHRTQSPLSHAEREEVVRSLRHFEGVRYDLHAWAVMDDHVHVVLTPIEGRSLESVLHSWKSFLAHRWRASRGAPVWQSEYFDHLVRNEASLEEIARYVLYNPEERWPLGEAAGEAGSKDGLEL